MVIVRIQPETLADGKLKVGDKVEKVNNIKIKDRDHFFKMISRAAPNARLQIIRFEEGAQSSSSSSVGAAAAELPADQQIPEDREKLIDHRAGYIYKVCFH
jgi:PDZ domain-containing secreted protein